MTPPAPSDRRIIYATATLRALATSMMGLLLGLYLGRLGYTPVELGVVLGTGLSGAALSALIVTFLGDRLGRRRSLVVLGLAAALGGGALAFTTDFLAVAALAFFGMVNGMGRDRGAMLVLEQAMLPGVTTDQGRTRAFAWYNVLQDVGHAAGSALVALPALLREVAGLGEIASFQSVVLLYAALQLAAALLCLKLSPAVEVVDRRPVLELSERSRAVLWRISALFALDSFAGGFLGSALLAYFFHVQFGASETAVAGLFLLARAANAFSHIGAAWLAERIGLVNTMVFTHIPSSLLLMLIPFAPSLWVAGALLLAREALVEMDVPTRQSYVMALVQPRERTFSSGLTHLVRMAGWAAAPFFAGPLMQGVALATPLFVAGGMKIAYDLLLFRAFRHVKPPEELAPR